MTQSEFRDAVARLAEFQSEKNFAEALFKLSKLTKKDGQGRTVVPVRFRLTVDYARERHASAYLSDTVEINMTTVNNGPQDTGNDAATLALARIVSAIRILATVENQLSIERLEAFQLPATVAEAIASPSCRDVPT